MNRIAIAIGVIILIILIAIYLSTRKKSAQDYYNRAEKASAKAEHYHDIGDEELSQEYSEEAEHYRKKAEEIHHELVRTA